MEFQVVTQLFLGFLICEMGTIFNPDGLTQGHVHENALRAIESYVSIRSFTCREIFLTFSLVNMDYVQSV